MRRYISAAIVACVLVLGVGFAAEPASAHQYDSNSYLACGATRPNSLYIVEHSHPVALTRTYADYACTGQVFNTQCAYWIARWSFSGGYTGHGYRFGPYPC